MNNTTAILLPHAVAGPTMAVGSPDPVPSRTVSLFMEMPTAERTVKSPRCLIGLPSAKRTDHLVASLHCDATRAYFRREGPNLKAGLLSGERRILLTHYASTTDEIPVAVELLKIADADYPCALMAAFALAGQLESPLTVEHIRLIVEEGAFEVDPAEPDENELTFAVIATRRAYLAE